MEIKIPDSIPLSTGLAIVGGVVVVKVVTGWMVGRAVKAQLKKQ
jgi:hypothetical protein